MTLAAAACDPGPETFADTEDGEATAGSDSGALLEASGADGVPASPAAGGGGVADAATFAFDPGVVAQHGPIALPFPGRAADLRPGEYWRKTTGLVAHGVAHDFSLVRFDEGTDAYSSTRNGYTGLDGPEGQVGFGAPVYSGVAGEVVSCWRDYDDWPEVGVGFSQFTDAQAAGNLVSAAGNHVIIKTTDNVAVTYAHLQDLSVPASICPKVSQFSEGGWLSDSAKFGSYTQESYLLPGNRPQIAVGQFLGRMGHTGRSTGSHVHVGAKNVTVNGDQLEVGDNRSISWSGVWAQPQTTTQEWAWDRVENEDLNDIYASLGTIVLLPGYETEGSLAKSDHATDFDGNGADDLFCFNSANGGRRVDISGWLLADYNATGEGWPGLYGSNSFPGNWCAGGYRALHTGDFNGDGKGDLLCHNQDTGGTSIDYAATNGGNFGVGDSQNSGFCVNANQQVFVADIDGDQNDDLLCHNYEDGTAFAFYAGNGGEFDGGGGAPLTEATADWTRATAWCYGAGYRLRMGDFDGDGSADQMCRKAETGRISIRYASGATWLQNTGWCSSGDQRIHLGDFNGDERDDILCYNQNTGRKWVNYASTSGEFSVSDWDSGNDGFCVGLTKKLVIGDFNWDGLDDLMCLDTVSGSKAVDWRGDDSVDFDGTDRILTTWCGGAATRTVF